VRLPEVMVSGKAEKGPNSIAAAKQKRSKGSLLSVIAGNDSITFSFY
jgi:hypothetical protein